MKKLIYPLIVVLATWFSSCQKDASLAPESKTPASATAVTTITNSLAPGNAAAGDSIMNVSGFIKLELKKDTINKDNIVIYFTPKASAAYVPGQDAPYLQGFGAESLSSLSSDGIPLSVNMLPLRRRGDCIKLDVHGKSTAVYKLSLVQRDSIPAKYHVWLMDRLRKDSLDLTVHHGYYFDLTTTDTTTFGKNRFMVKVRPQ
ncbi:MAG: hypothetical protein JO080_15490 [Mucilaginibacter sp.]|nr:hypothetical protein [Mucilaginibacter sp.]